MNIPDKLRQYIKSRQTEKMPINTPFFLNFAGKERQSLFFCYSDAHTALAADRQETEEIFRQKAHLKAALIFCHVPQRDVMVPAQIEKRSGSRPVTRIRTVPFQKAFPCCKRTPPFSIGMIGIITLIETSLD